MCIPEGTGEMLQPHHLIVICCVAYLHCQVLSESQHWLGNLLPCACPSLHTIHLCHQQQESELSVGPPFCLPHLFQSNRIMLTIVDNVDSMLCTVVAAEGLGVLERLPLPVDEAPHRMILNFLRDTVRPHYLCDVVCISGAVHKES
jgi:hypothetical protein